MEAHLIYLLKTNLALTVCFFLYRFLLSNDTFFRFRRSFLLFTIFFSFLSPLLWLPSVTETVQQHFAVITLPEVFSGGVVEMETTGQVSRVPSLLTQLAWIYGVGLVLFSMLFLLRILSIFRIITMGEKQRYKGLKIILPKEGEGPFSFFRFIVIDLNAYTKEAFDEIILHEQEHVRSLHSFDIILAELTKTVCWFNPVAWQFRRAVECNNEHLADEKVLQSQIDKKSYQYNLINISQVATAESLANCYTVKHLKKRIIMMNKKQTRESARIKYLFSGLLALSMMLGVNAATNTASLNSVGEKKQNPYFKEVKNDKAQDDSMRAFRSILIIAKDIDPESELLVNKRVDELYGIQNLIVIKTKLTANELEKVHSLSEIDPGDIVDLAVFKKGHDKEKTTLNKVDKMPEFPGGINALFQFVNENMKYPTVAKENGIEGRVVCQFVVKADGSIHDVRVERGIDPALDKEAIRVIESMPKWIPGEDKGKAVNAKMTLPIYFGQKKKELKGEIIKVEQK